MTPAEMRQLATLKAKQKAERKAVRVKRETHAPTKPMRGRLEVKVHRQFVGRLPCVAGAVEGGCSGPIEAAHLRFSDFTAGRTNPGLQRKSDDVWVVPLCAHHHRYDQHKGSERAFWARLGVDPNALAKALYAVSGDLEAGVAAIMEHIREKAA